MPYFKFHHFSHPVYSGFDSNLIKIVANNQDKVFYGSIIEYNKIKIDKLDLIFWDNELEEVAAPQENPHTESEFINKHENIVNTIETDVVNKPSHYQFSEYEPIKVIQAWDLSFALGNVVKYIARAGRKDSSKLIEDLEKAKRYLELELEHLKK